MRILHIFYNSHPNISGASTRNRDIVESQNAIDQLQPIVITAPFQQPLRSMVERINGVIYIRTTGRNSNLNISENKSSIIVKARKAVNILSFFFKTLKLARRVNPSIIHAHSMFFCGLTGWFISWRLGVPYIYEVRSLWEERGYGRDKTFLGKLQYRLILFLENLSIKNANTVIVINKNLKAEIASRAIIAESKIKIVHNAVNFNRIKSLPSNNASILDKNFEELVFGYIGTVAAIEGLIYLFRAFEILSNEGIKNKLFIYGDGNEKKELVKFLAERNLPNIEMKGSLQPPQIWEAYSNIDLIINPRVSEKITNQVTPLKPLEAMAYKKVVLGSNVGGLLELIEHGQTGLIFESDSKVSIVHIIKEIKVMNRIELNKIALSGFDYVQRNRSWGANAKEYFGLYNNLLNEN